MSKRHVSRRWAIQHDFAVRERGEAPNWMILGMGWMKPPVHTLPYAHVWPASFKSRKEARAMAKQLTDESRQHSPSWLFRAVAIAISVRVVGEKGQP
jgi:hypothetical protein